MSNPLKSIGKAVKNILKPITNIFKKYGKEIMIGAAIYFTGGALGLWGGGSTAAAGGAAAGEVAAGAAGAASAGAATGASALGTAAGVTQSLAAAQTPLMMQAAINPVAAGAAAGATTAGIGTSLASAGKSILGFIEKYPSAGLIAGQMLSSAFTPSEAEIAEEIERNRRDNSTYWGVPGTQRGGVQPRQFTMPSAGVPTAGVRPAGLVSSNMRG